jgi:hypothetical protein
MDSKPSNCGIYVVIYTFLGIKPRPRHNPFVGFKRHKCFANQHNKNLPRICLPKLTDNMLDV